MIGGAWPTVVMSGEITNAAFLLSKMMLAENYPKKYTPLLLDYKITP